MYEKRKRNSFLRRKYNHNTPDFNRLENDWKSLEYQEQVKTVVEAINSSDELPDVCLRLYTSSGMALLVASESEPTDLDTVEFFRSGSDFAIAVYPDKLDSFENSGKLCVSLVSRSFINVTTLITVNKNDGKWAITGITYNINNYLGNVLRDFYEIAIR